MTTLRLPLVNSLEGRDGVVKDDLITNGFIEQSYDNNLYVYKRPGLLNKRTRTGTAKGIFIYNNSVYIWDTSNTNTTPTVIAIGSL